MIYDELDKYLVLWGGGDIDPSLYGEKNRFSSGINKLRDEKEVEMFKAAVKERRPILGICRGHQLIAALRGGALWQDMKEQTGVSHAFNHRVLLSGLFKETFGKPSITVNSLHHQAVRRIPKGALLGANCANGIIEALYYPATPKFPPMVGVQWHPEMMDVVHFDKVIGILKKLEENDVWSRR